MASVYLDPDNLPSQIMLQWHDGSWEHRAYWGASIISYGNDGRASRRYMSTLQLPGQWVRLNHQCGRPGWQHPQRHGLQCCRWPSDLGCCRQEFSLGQLYYATANQRTHERGSRHRQSIRQRMWSRRHRQIPEQTSPPAPPASAGTDALPGLSIIDYATLALSASHGTNALRDCASLS